MIVNIVIFLFLLIKKKKNFINKKKKKKKKKKKNILINIFTNDIFDKCIRYNVIAERKKCCDGLYADDIVLLAPTKSFL